jgi:hypothetical protein
MSIELKFDWSCIVISNWCGLFVLEPTRINIAEETRLDVHRELAMVISIKDETKSAVVGFTE